MPIPSGIPTLYVEVKNGSGGENHDSIPVKEDLGGPTTGHLRNGALWVRIVDPAYPGISRYRKTWNGTTWVSFDIRGEDFIPGQESWCEYTGHLYPLEVIPPAKVKRYKVTMDVTVEEVEDG